MASVRLEEETFSCMKYERLAEYAGLADSDHARGKMARLWRQCTLEQIHVLSESDVVRVLGANGVRALCDAGLGEIAPGGVRIKGTKGRIEWLKKLRTNGKKGGRPRKPKGKPSGYCGENPLTPSLVVSISPSRDASLPSAVGSDSPQSDLPSLSASQTRAHVGDPPAGMASMPTQRRLTLQRWLEPARRLWALQDELRKGIDPELRALKPTAERLYRVAAVLEAGADPDDCAAVLRKYAADGDARWFNGETNWRPANFDRALGMAGAKAPLPSRGPGRGLSPEEIWNMDMSDMRALGSGGGDS